MRLPAIALDRYGFVVEANERRKAFSTIISRSRTVGCSFAIWTREPFSRKPSIG
jgi:hypothetical protein